MAARVALGLRGAAEAGVPIRVMVGNRDFLLGPRFAAAAGAALLPERVVIDLAGTPTVLLHGDELCTGDTSYQRLRRALRSPMFQRPFLALPYGLRRSAATWLRGRSSAATAGKAESILDVEPRAVEAAFRAAGTARMIHGHTHRPHHHHLVVDGCERDRWVLADWYGRGSYLEVDPDGPRVRDV
jgi:UDP-2,3-diacylglucosamine hydrolase